MGNVLN